MRGLALKVCRRYADSCRRARMALLPCVQRALTWDRTLNVLQVVCALCFSVAVIAALHYALHARETRGIDVLLL
jgi:hypothetical protein